MKTNAVSLFVLWLAIAGFITFFGYMMIAPLVIIGDTGKVFQILGVPFIIQIVFAILSLIVITVILIRSTRLFEKYAIETFGSIKENRKKWAFSLILVPLLSSIGLVTILQLPIPHFASILATTCAPFSIMAIFGTFSGSKKELNRALKGKSINEKISVTLLILFFLAVCINRFLVTGV